MSEVYNIRSSSWADLFDCAHRYEGKQILGMDMPASGRMHLGTSIHHSTAVFDQARLDHVEMTPDDAAGEFVNILRRPIAYDLSDDVVWDEKLSENEAEAIGLRLHTRYCTEISPNYEFKAVELRPEPLIVEVPEHNCAIELTGQLDRSRVRREKKGISISDLKTGALAANKKGEATVKGHWIQAGCYEMLAEHSLGEVIAGDAEIIGLQTTKAGNIGVSPVKNAQLGLIGTNSQPGLIQMAANMLSTGLFPPNPKSLICGEKYCVRWPVCKYRAQ